MALAKDDTENIVASEPARMNISTIRADTLWIYDLSSAQQARNAYNASQSQITWDFARIGVISKRRKPLLTVSAGSSLADILENTEL